VHCFGYGEPTIHPQFPEFIKHISRFEVLIDFFTNGMHLTDELVKFIVDSNVWEMTISFSGSTKMEYENVYQGGNFEHVLAGLARLRDYKKETDKKYPRVAVNSLAYRHHLLAFDRFVELMGSHGANIIFLKPLMEWGQTLPALTGHSALITPEINATVMKRAEDAARFYGVRLWISPELYVDSEAEERKKLLTLSGLTQEEFAKHKERIPVARFKEVAQETIPATNDNYTWDEVSKHDLLVMQPEEIRKILDVQRTELSQGTDKNFYCMEPFKVMYVMEDGHTKPCCNVPSFAPSLGNVMTHGGEPVWRGAGFAAYQDSILNNEYPLRGCRDCLRLKNGPRSHFFDQFLNEYFSWYSDVHGFDRSKDAFPELETLGDGTDVYHRFQAARP
jgi:MoaA/NifB/PqqE/SkfB family radical SAM enzyme